MEAMMGQDWRQNQTEEGESPFSPPGPRNAPAAQPEQGQEHVPEWSGDDPHGGVSWEELRKGLPPEGDVNDPEAATHNERFASERQALGIPDGTWQPVEADTPADRAPDWPPGPGQKRAE
jgi:hypothetical protein